MLKLYDSLATKNV